MNEIVDKVQEILNSQDEKYSRIIREYATVKDISGNKELAEQYIREIRENTFEQIEGLVGKVPESEKNEVFPGFTKEKMVEYAGIIPLIQAEINGSEDQELAGLIKKYNGTEWDSVFRTLLKPRLKELKGSGPEKARIANSLSRQLLPALNEDDQIRERFLGDIKTLLFFGDGKAITVGTQPNRDGRFLLGNGERRNISIDLEQATVDFSIQGKKEEPLVKTRTIGGKMIREVEYCYKWNQ